MKGRKPDFNVAALDKSTELKGNIGAAWNNEDGTISVVLNPFVNLQQTGNMIVTLFPNKNEKVPYGEPIPEKYRKEPIRDDSGKMIGLKLGNGEVKMFKSKKNLGKP